MKKLSVILFVFCLTFPFLGAYSWFQFKKYQVRKEIKLQIIRGMDKNDLVLIKVLKDEASVKLRWVNSREFEAGGHMYDVVKSMVICDTLFFFCWPDHAETRLNRQLTELVAQAMEQHPQSKDHNKRLAEFFKSLYSPPGSGGIGQINLTDSQQLLNPGRVSLSSVVFPPPSPPPKSV